MYRLLIVEDDETIARELAKRLRAWDYEVECIEDFQQVLARFTAFAPQLVLLDISLPFFNGYHWCREIRKVSNVPILFLSGMADNMNIVMAMHMGADDFIAKPFDPDVLVAKVQALLRRTYDFASGMEMIAFQDALCNLSDGTVRFQDASVELSKNEMRILKCLLENKGKVVSRNELIMKLWQTDQFIDDNTLTVNVTRMRKKLQSIGLDGCIKTKKGLGYYVE